MRGKYPVDEYYMIANNGTIVTRWMDSKEFQIRKLGGSPIYATYELAKNHINEIMKTRKRMERIIRNEAIIRRYKELIDAGWDKTSAYDTIGNAYGLSETTICNIVKGRTWKRLANPDKRVPSADEIRSKAAAYCLGKEAGWKN